MTPTAIARLAAALGPGYTLAPHPSSEMVVISALTAPSEVVAPVPTAPGEVDQLAAAARQAVWAP